MKDSFQKEADARLRMISADELAVILDLSVDSVYRLVRQGDIPAYRIGRTVRFDMDRVLAKLSCGLGDDHTHHSDVGDKIGRRPAVADRRRDDA